MERGDDDHTSLSYNVNLCAENRRRMIMVGNIINVQIQTDKACHSDFHNVLGNQEKMPQYGSVCPYVIYSYFI